jgi:glycosyltransferase involved in cell wall biosynthesis
MSASPLVSIIMPSYNHASYVAAAAASVLAQTVDDLELIAIDDGSSDGSPAILADLAARDPRIRLLARANNGAPASINEGIARSRGKWIGIINSDDCYDARRLETMLKAVEDARAAWAFSRVEFIDGSGKPAPSDTTQWYRDLQADIWNWPSVGFSLLKHNATITTGNLFFSRALFDAVGPFRELVLVHDWDFALRALRYAEPVYVDHDLYCYRFHHQNSIRSIAQTTTDREVAFVLRDFLLGVILERPINRLAPNPYTWPLYFEAVINRLDFQGKPYHLYMPSRQELQVGTAQAAAHRAAACSRNQNTAPAQD